MGSSLWISATLSSLRRGMTRSSSCHEPTALHYISWETVILQVIVKSVMWEHRWEMSLREQNDLIPCEWCNCYPFDHIPFHRPELPLDWFSKIAIEGPETFLGGGVNWETSSHSFIHIIFSFIWYIPMWSFSKIFLRLKMLHSRWPFAYEPVS